MGDRGKLMDKLLQIFKFHNPLLEVAGKQPYHEDDVKMLCDDYMQYGKCLREYITDTTRLIHQVIREDKKIVLEGAQATFLDLDHGSYPDVTSSHPTASGTCHGAGIGPIYVEEVIGVMKAYCTRVGEGVFPTEQNNEIGDRIRELGHEYGTTTGRPRRCGWLDLVMLKYADEVNGLTALALNHMDTIGKFEEIKVCVAYQYQGKEIDYVPVDHENCTPIYKSFKGGWNTEGAISLADLGHDANEFINFIEEYAKVPVAYIGIGPDARQTICR